MRKAIAILLSVITLILVTRLRNWYCSNVVWCSIAFRPGRSGLGGLIWPSIALCHGRSEWGAWSVKNKKGHTTVISKNELASSSNLMIYRPIIYNPSGGEFDFKLVRSRVTILTWTQHLLDHSPSILNLGFVCTKEFVLQSVKQQTALP